MKKILFIFINKMLSLKRKKAFIAIFLMIFSKNIYALQKTSFHHQCRTLFSHQGIQSKSQKLKKERSIILSKPKYHGPDGYNTYLQENPESLLGVSFKNILSVFSKEELEMIEWHYIEFDMIKFGKITQIKGKKIIVNYIYDKSIKTRKLSKKQLRTVQPSSIARNRMKLREALEKEELTEDERYISIPSFYLPDQYGRILEVSENTVLVEIIGYNGKLKKVQLSENAFLKAKINPVSKDWFNRIEKAVETLEILRPIEENEEENLTKKGYKKVLIQGINTANRLITLGKHIRKFHINPFSTHIEDFAQQIPDHIETIRQGIQSQDTDIAERLNLLKQFERESYRKIEDSAVTYMWWIFWNQRLSILATPSQKRKEKGDWWKSEENLENFLNHLNEEGLTEFNKDGYMLMKLIQQFPSKVIFPIISDLGPMAFNRISMHSIAPLQLTGKEKWMDGELNTPEMALSHDIYPAALQLKQKNSSLPSLKKLFYQQIIDVNNLPVYEREVIEIIYFLIEHELEWMNIDHPQAITDMMTNKNMQKRFQNPNDLGRWIEEGIKANSLRSYLLKMAKTFNHSSAPILEKIKSLHIL